MRLRDAEAPPRKIMLPHSGARGNRARFPREGKNFFMPKNYCILKKPWYSEIAFDGKTARVKNPKGGNEQ
jgi:hypothetical protein